MFGQLGVAELGIIAVIALVIFGPKALPSLGKSIGGGIRALKDGLRTVDEHEEIE